MRFSYQFRTHMNFLFVSVIVLLLMLKLLVLIQRIRWITKGENRFSPNLLPIFTSKYFNVRRCENLGRCLLSIIEEAPCEVFFKIIQNVSYFFNEKGIPVLETILIDSAWLFTAGLATLFLIYRLALGCYHTSHLMVSDDRP